RPKVRLFFTQPVKKQRGTELPGNLLWIASQGRASPGSRRNSKALAQGLRSAVIGKLQSLFGFAGCNQKIQIVVVKPPRVSEKGQAVLTMKQRRARAFEDLQAFDIVLLRVFPALALFVKVTEIVFGSPSQQLVTLWVTRNFQENFLRTR